MTTENESLLIKPTSQRQFELHALSLEREANFEPSTMFAAYQVGRGSACGCILLDHERGTFGTLALRRRVDHTEPDALKLYLLFVAQQSELRCLLTDSFRGAHPDRSHPL